MASICAQCAWPVRGSLQSHKTINSRQNQWPFEKEEDQEKKTKSSGYVDRIRPRDGFSLGYEATHTVKAESKIRREYFDVAEALIDSSEVHVYNKYGVTWAKIEVKDGSFNRNTYEDVTDFNVQFNIKLSKDGRVIW